MRRNHGNYIDGAWVDGAAMRDNRNPSDLSDSVGLYAQADAAQAAHAVAAAAAAQVGWAHGGIQARADALDFIGTELLARRQELGTLLAREEGKTLPEAMAEVGRAGLPDGVFNLLMGRGGVVGQALLDDRRIDAVSFTGSAATGAKVARAAIGRMAKVQIEMGGKNPLVVLNDADLANAVHCAVQGSFYSTGQRCTASSRIIVEKGLYPAFVAAVKEKLSTLRVGDALRPDTDIGPVASADQLEQDLRYIGIGRDEGATLAFGGGRVQRDTDGYYLTPALFTDCDNAMRICREEIFGPVAAVIPADSYEHALALANDTEFGLSSGICTGSLKHAAHFKRHAQAGMVMVNVPTAGVDYHVPFGGSKGSSYGAREQGTYAAEFFTRVKTTYLGN